MNNRTYIRTSACQLSIEQAYSSTEKVLKTLANYLPRYTSTSDLEIYQNGYEAFKKLHLPDMETGLTYIETRQIVIDALNRRLEITPKEELYRKQIQKLENGLLLLEQCSPKVRCCLITNESILPNNKTPQFIFINQCGLSSAGILRLMTVAKKYENSETGLYTALKEITDPSQQGKTSNISARDILRLQLHIEKIKIFPPTLKGMAYGFIAGGLTSLLILSLVSLPLPALIIVAVLPSIIGAGTGLMIEKVLVKKELCDKIGPTPVFSLASSLSKLLANNESKPSSWNPLFHARTGAPPTVPPVKSFSPELLPPPASP